MPIQGYIVFFKPLDKNGYKIEDLEEISFLEKKGVKPHSKKVNMPFDFKNLVGKYLAFALREECRSPPTPFSQ